MKIIVDFPREVGMIDRLISVAEAAEALSINPTTLWRWITQGKFPAVRVGRLWKVKQTDVEAYIEAHTTGK